MSIISLRHVRSTEQIIWSHEPKGSTAAMVLFAVFGGQTCSSVIYFEMLKWTETLGWKWYLCHLWPWTGGDSYGLCFLFTNLIEVENMDPGKIMFFHVLSFTPLEDVWITWDDANISMELAWWSRNRNLLGLNAQEYSDFHLSAISCSAAPPVMESESPTLR